MKKLLLIIAVLFITLSSYAQDRVWVNGYTKSNGTYVQGHYRTKSDNTNTNNWSTVGNTNPNTNEAGTRASDYSTEASSYGAGSTIYTGPRGGQYYINSNGNKTYVPKQTTSSSSLYNYNFR